MRHTRLIHRDLLEPIPVRHLIAVGIRLDLPGLVPVEHLLVVVLGDRDLVVEVSLLLHFDQEFFGLGQLFLELDWIVAISRRHNLLLGRVLNGRLVGLLPGRPRLRHNQLLIVHF